VTKPNLRVPLPPAEPELMRGLDGLSEGELCHIIGNILARPGEGFTEQELDELAAINAEFIRRENGNRKSN
jgi:hypothetical protein